jgi:predicted Zn-dependent protease
VRFPQGWDVINTDEQVAARQNETSNVAMILELAPGSGPVQQAGPAQMAAAGWRQVSGQATRINGLDAYVGLYEGVSGNTRIAVQAAHIRAGDQTYVIAGVAPASEFQGARSTFSNSIGTFRTISRQEADSIQENRLDFYTVRPGDTWESIARAAARDAVKASTLAIMNGSDPGTAPRSGARIRIVVAG